MKKLQEKSNFESEPTETQRRPKQPYSNYKYNSEFTEEQSESHVRTDSHKTKRTNRDVGTFDEEEYWSLVNEEPVPKPDYTNPKPKKIIRKQSQENSKNDTKVVIDIPLKVIYT